MHLDAALEQVVRRLRDADVGLDAAHERLVAAVEVEAVGAAAEKQVFSTGSTVAQLLDGAAEPLRVLLGDHDRDAEDLRALHQAARVLDDVVEVLDGGPEGLLHVDHDERGPLPVERPHAGTAPMANERSR